MQVACLIPEEILSSLSTEDLTGICLKYPLLNNTLGYYGKLYEYWLNGFNGYWELFKRNDALNELMKHYNCLMQEISLLSIQEPSLERAFLRRDIDNYEFLIGLYTQKADNLPKKECKKMLQSLLCAYEKEIVLTSANSSFPYNLRARANLINKINPIFFEKMQYLCCLEDMGFFTRKEDIDIINELSYQLIK